MGKRTPGKWVSEGPFIFSNDYAKNPLARFDGSPAQATSDAAYAASAVRAHDDLCDGLREALDMIEHLCVSIVDPASDLFEVRETALGMLKLADHATLYWQSAHPGEAFEYEVTK